MVYFDTNVIKKLWLQHLREHPSGDLNLPKPNIFEGVLLSEYNIDELLNIETKTSQTINASKMNAHILLMLLQQNTVVRPIIQSIDSPELNTPVPPISALQSDMGGIKNYLVTYLLGLARGNHHPLIDQQIQNRSKVIAQSKIKATPSVINKKMTVEQAIDFYLTEKCLPLPLKDFFILQQYLSELKRSKTLRAPDNFKAKDFYKPNHQFAENIDFFHISYAPLVETFVTDDRVVRYILEILKSKSLITCNILNHSQYYSEWFKGIILS